MRFLDVVFFIYFLTHIPIALFVDFQGLFPLKYFPEQLIGLKEWYCREYRDPMLITSPAWYKSLIVCELFQFPFFFIAAYGFFKGARKCKWLRLPCIIYGSHVATTLAPIIAHVLLHDFSHEKLPSPRNLNERLLLLSFYSPYFLIPVAIVLDAVFSSAYRHSSQDQQQKHTKKIK